MGLTINGMVTMAYETATANGWHEDTGEVISPAHPQAQIAALSPVANAMAWVIEMIRKPPKRFPLAVFLQHLADEGVRPHTQGLERQTNSFLDNIDESSGPLRGSKTQALAWLRLIDTETAEATRAVINGDTGNLAEELADIVIRVGDFVGAWNEAHPDRPIDLETAIIDKNERNRTRGYRHGGKLA